jgi:hypothetical protein
MQDYYPTQEYYFWRKTSDSLPEHGEYVWVARSGFTETQPYIAKRSYDMNTEDQDMWLTLHEGIIEVPTYWHPLQPPIHPERRELQ